MNVSTIKVNLALVRKLAPYWGSSIPDTKVRPVFVRSGYLMKGYTPTILNVDVDEGLIKETVDYEGTVQRVFKTDRFGFSRDRLNSFVLASCSEEEGVGL